MDAAELYQSLELTRPLAARLAKLSCLPVRVAPALLRLVRLRLLPQGGTGDEADLWLSDLIETRAAGAFAFRPAVRTYLRERLREEAGLLDEVWHRVHVEHGRWIAPRARLEEELTWRLLRQRGDPAIESLWAGVVQELDAGPNVEGVARWVVRATADLPGGTLDHPSGRRAYYGSHLLLGDARVLGQEPQQFLTSGEFSFATRRLPRRRIFVGLNEGALLVSPLRQIENGHDIDIPATQPLWLQLEQDTGSLSVAQRTVITIDDTEPVRMTTEAEPVVLRAIDGAAYAIGLLRDGQRSIPRIRPPKVQLEYDLELYGAAKRIQLPFVMGVLADLSGKPSQALPPVEDRKFLDIDVDNFDSRMKALKPRVAFRVPNTISGEGDLNVELAFENMDDFSPAGVARGFAPLNVLLEATLRESNLAAQLTEQLNLILHHPDFQTLEGTWRGLHYLVTNTETDEMLKIRFLNINKAELANALRGEGGASRDQSAIFKKIHEAEYGQFGGEPFGCLVGDYYFDHALPDIQLLSEMSKVSAAAHCPFITGASPTVMQIASWQELANVRDVAKVLDGPEHADWRSLRESEDARYLGLTMPRFLTRMPYGPGTDPVEEFDFEEDTGAADPTRYTWANAAYAMAVNINRAFKLYGWCARIGGIESGGIVENLPTHSFPTDDGGVAPQCPTEIAIGDRRDAEMGENGFLPLVHRKSSNVSAFFGVQSLQKPRKYDTTEAATHAARAARLSYLFPCCRFAHYVKCIVRDKIASFRDRDDLGNSLNGWLMNYVNGDPVAPDAVRARMPLTAAELQLEQGNDPGYYLATLFLRPQYQLEHLESALRLVTRLPSAKS